MTSIGEYTFFGCSGLTRISLPEGVTSIGDEAFSGCRSLTSVFLPSSMTSIGAHAFADSPDLIEFYCFAKEVPSTGSNVFYHIDDWTTLYVPASSVTAYKSSKPWSDFARIIGLTDDEMAGVHAPAFSKGGETWYDLNGRKTANTQDGIHIIRYADGTTKKILVR